MKKDWIAPKLEELDLSATQGGPIENFIEDQESYFDEVNQYWVHITGKEDELSV